MTVALRSIAALLLFVVPIAAQQNNEWDDLYREAVRHVRAREWPQAEAKLLQASKTGPPSGPDVIRRGIMGRDDYFPEYYLGIVYLNTGRAAQAVTQFEIARRRRIDPRKSEFRQLGDLESRAKSIAEADAKLTAKPDPRVQYKMLVDQAQQLFNEARYDEAEAGARQAIGLGVPDGAAETLLQNIERIRGAARLKQALSRSLTLAELRQLLSDYEGTGVPVDELKRRLATAEGTEVRSRNERAGMIEFFAGNYQKSIGLLAEAEMGGPLTARGHFYRACSLASLATRGKGVNQAQLREARRSYALAAQSPDEFRNDLRYISPRLLQLLRE